MNLLDLLIYVIVESTFLLLISRVHVNFFLHHSGFPIITSCQGENTSICLMITYCITYV